MKKTFAILFATTALTVGVGLPAWSAIHDGPRPQASREAVGDASDDGATLLFASDDGRRDRDHGRRFGRGDDDDDYGYRGGAAGPAPAGTVTPPNNGLFGSGAAPKVKVN